MSDSKLSITPKTKVGEILEHYPQLEAVLIEMSPAFSKLKNPILRKTIGKVATLQQAASIGNVSIDILVNRLREAAGQAGIEISEEENKYAGDVPAWMKSGVIVNTFDAVPVINKGEHPMGLITKKAGELNNGEILELITPFVPAPILDILEEKGFSIYCVKESDNLVKSYIFRS
jgi:hypothetical protein